MTPRARAARKKQPSSSGCASLLSASFRPRGSPSVFSPGRAGSAHENVISAEGAKPAPATVPSSPYPTPLCPTRAPFEDTEPVKPFGFDEARTLCVRRPVSESRGLAFAPFASEITSFSSPRNGAPRNAKSNRRNGSRRDSCTNARTAPIGSRGPNIPRSCVPSGRRTRTVTGSVRFVFLSSSSSSSFFRASFHARVVSALLASRAAFARANSAATSLASRLKNSSSSCARAAADPPTGGTNARAPRPPAGGFVGSTARALR